MSTAFLDLSDAIVAALGTAPALAGGRIRRGRRTSVAQRETSAIHVHTLVADGEDIDYAGTGVQWHTTVGVSVYVRATVDADAEQAVDELLAATWARLRGMALPAGASALAVEPRIQWDVDEADQTLSVARLAVRAQHITTGAALVAA